ncbi:CRISPR-associated endonuclease Cas1 [Thiocapsa imhoffii]|uniref:CRISPR-associated endonuclease Cas1 n=1 Tax=Thiocapsa imhoffii TaxID=382777 RepID=A0A9X0WIQ0_9GAMM|nr:CRISPR-associated endonuclease Cas1 [Thiocapsa imhoffii]MBK1645481.1 CRISPR-associated endonuclease Cas1 [Thiocapsa imhoffii]
MQKATMIADQAGACLSFKQGVIILEQPGGACHRVGIDSIKQILVTADLYLSSRLIDSCLAAGVSLVILPGRPREPARHLFPQAQGALWVRLAQYSAYLDEAQRLAVAQSFVVSKIKAQAECLRQHGVHLPLEDVLASVQKTTEIGRLLGVEGASTARYFNQWANLHDPAWGFQGRSRRPPRDPVNSLMSLGYTLVCHAVGRIATRDGFEAALGFLHAPASGRPSLALDLIEPLRPWVDEWVLTMMRADDGFRLEDFKTDPENGCRLTKEASGRFFQRWYTGAEPWLEHVAREHLDALRTMLGLKLDKRVRALFES